MDFQLTEQQELIRKEVASLARSFSLDYWLEKDRKAEYPTDWIRAFAQAGWLGMIIPSQPAWANARMKSVGYSAFRSFSSQ